jgi:hypothetical protein
LYVNLEIVPRTVIVWTKLLGQSLVGDRGMKKIDVKSKDPLSFEIWIFRNGQPDHDDNRIIFVATTSKLTYRSTHYRLLHNISQLVR